MPWAHNMPQAILQGGPRDADSVTMSQEMPGLPQTQGQGPQHLPKKDCCPVETRLPVSQIQPVQEVQ